MKIIENWICSNLYEVSILSSEYNFKFKNIHKIYIHNIVLMVKLIDLWWINLIINVLIKIRKNLLKIKKTKKKWKIKLYKDDDIWNYEFIYFVYFFISYYSSYSKFNNLLRIIWNNIMYY